MKLYYYVFLSAFLFSCQTHEFVYYGKKDTLLKGMSFKTASVFYVKDSIESMLGVPTSASYFKVKAKVNVQTACHITWGEWETAYAEFEMIICNDIDYQFHNLMIDSIYKYWTEKDKVYLDNYITLPAYCHIFYEWGTYIPYFSMIKENDDWVYYFYYSEKLVKLKFIRFLEKEGWGPLESFITDVLIIRAQNNKKINISYKSYISPNEFLTMYKNGAFKK